MEGITLLIVVSAAIGGIFILITALSYLYGLKGIKAKTAGNGQQGPHDGQLTAKSKRPTVTFRLPRKNGGRIRAADRRSKALWLAVYPKRKRQRHLWTRVMFIV